VLRVRRPRIPQLRPLNPICDSPAVARGPLTAGGRDPRGLADVAGRHERLEVWSLSGMRRRARRRVA
jgi:hypothetical protein